MAAIYKFGKSKEKKDRNKDIYIQRVVEKRTLQAIGKKYGITKERVRQLVQLQRKYYEVPDRVELMGDLPLNTKLRLILGRYKELETPIVLFIKKYNVEKLIKIPSVGPTSVCLLYKLLDERGYDVQNLWTPRNREDYDTFKYGRICFRLRDFTQ
tara:strand:+ start:480 stop:944 length:465 start_codon:yes stop_codon:yes gene_type:complete